MDAATALQPITYQPTVTDRRGHDRGNPGAFRRALQQQAEQPAEQAAEAREEPEGPVRTTLQQRPPADRRDGGTRHVDLLA